VSGRITPIAAQVAAEVKTRLRSPATLVALLLVFAGSVLWIPDPRGNASSLSWRLADGREQAPVYNSAYIGFAASALACIAVTLVGFYLVAGSVRRDRESGVGAILAATPLSRAAYLAGKFAAHCAYLSVVLGLALLAALTAWFRFGVGPFSPSDFFLPFLLLSMPAVAVTASFAVLFDVAPGLSGRGGYVVWFFVFSLVLVALPMLMAGADEKGVLRRWPVLDPAGLATQAALARQSVPGAVGFSTGLEIRDTPFTRVPWNGIAISPRVVAVRALNLLLAVTPLGLAVVLFDRFDPARRRRRARKPGLASRLADRFRRRPPVATSEATAVAMSSAVALSPVAARPSAGRATLAEARLIWDAASFLKWPLLGSAILAGFLPGNGAAAVFFLLLVPIVSEVAAREVLAGTSALVFSQPGVPASAVLWKFAAVAVFLSALGAPLVIRVFIASPVRGLAAAAGILFVAGAAVGLGSLTAGGKLFSGVYLALWYFALNNLPQADFAGVLGKAPVPLYSVVYLSIALALVSAAAVRARWRER
jgi:hypothetical protein